MSHISGRRMGCWEGNTSKQDYETSPQANEYHWEVYHCKQRWINSLWVKNLSHNQEKQGSKSPYLLFMLGKNGRHMLCSFFICFFGINWFFQCILVQMLHWVFNPARKKKNSAQCPPPALIIAPPFLIEWLLAQGLIGSFKSHAAPLWFTSVGDFQLHKGG